MFKSAKGLERGPRLLMAMAVGDSTLDENGEMEVPKCPLALSLTAFLVL